jgi:hypothetical protein
MTVMLSFMKISKLMFVILMFVFEYEEDKRTDIEVTKWQQSRRKVIPVVTVNTHTHKTEKNWKWLTSTNSMVLILSLPRTADSYWPSQVISASTKKEDSPSF